MVNIVIQGVAGRMGHALATLIRQRQDCVVLAGVDTKQDISLPFPVFSSLDELPQMPDVLIDFSHPVATEVALAWCAQNKVPCVVCTTGLDENVKQKIADAARETAVFYSANMSLGVNLLAELAQRAQAMLPGFDIEIIEKHHHHKLDAPSGTALLLADAINEQANGAYEYVYDRHAYRKARDANEIGIHAVRGGSIVGDHDVLFAGPDEVITLSHSAGSRDIFANGAVTAALYIVNKAAGLYNMQNMMAEL